MCAFGDRGIGGNRGLPCPAQHVPGANAFWQRCLAIERQHRRRVRETLHGAEGNLLLWTWQRDRLLQQIRALQQSASAPRGDRPAVSACVRGLRAELARIRHNLVIARRALGPRPTEQLLRLEALRRAAIQQAWQAASAEGLDRGTGHRLLQRVHLAGPYRRIQYRRRPARLHLRRGDGGGNWPVSRQRAVGGPGVAGVAGGPLHRG